MENLRLSPLRQGRFKSPLSGKSTQREAPTFCERVHSGRTPCRDGRDVMELFSVSKITSENIIEFLSLRRMNLQYTFISDTKLKSSKLSSSTGLQNAASTYSVSTSSSCLCFRIIALTFFKNYIYLIKLEVL